MVLKLRREENNENRGRIHMLSLRVLDRPGVLQACVKILADVGINIVSSHVFHRGVINNKREAQITIFIENYIPLILDKLKSLDFVLDIHVFELSSPESVPDVVIFPINILQDAMREIASNYGEPVTASIFYKLGYMYGQSLAQSYIEELMNIENNILRLTALLNMMKSLNLLKEFKIDIVENRLVIVLKEPIELRGKCLENCYFTKGLLTGSLEKCIPSMRIVDERIRCNSTEYEIIISVLPSS